MNKKIFSIAIAAILCALCTSAQVDSLYRDIEPWLESPALHKLPDTFKGESAVFLLDSRIFRYKNEGKSLVQYNYVYKLIKVQDDKGIEMFNKIYLPVS